MKKFILPAALAAAVMLAGCSSNGSPEESTIPETEPPIVSESISETASETEKTETETETEPESADAEGGEIISIIGDGFITYSREDISELLAESGIAVKNVTSYKAGDPADDMCLYRFIMVNDESVGEFQTDSETVYCSTLFIGDEVYLVVFGTDEYNTLEETLPYCTEGKTVECWAYAATDENGTVTLLPIIAGSEESGYYAVIPVFAFQGADVSGMSYPDFPLGTDSDPDVPAAEYGDGKILIDITGVENMDTMTRADCSVTNTYPFDAVISGKNVTLNGADLGDSATVYFDVKSGETLTDEFFYIDGCALQAGDVLVLTGTLMDGSTFKDIGDITFTFNID